MSKSRLQHTIDHFKQQLLQHEASAETAIDTAHRHALVAIQPALDKLYEEIAKKMDAGEPIPPSFVYERLRLEHIQLLIQRQIDQFGGAALLTTRMQQHLGAQIGLQSAQALLDTTVPSGVSWTFGVPSVKAIANIVGATQKGSPLADLFAGFGSEAANNVAGVLARGITLGQNPRTIAGDVANALGISRARALTISRNEMLRAYRNANQETFKANSDTVSQWRWTADKSARTCAACIVMDGTLHDLDEEFGSHVQCRCSPSPVTKPWTDILGPLGIDTSDISEIEPPQSGSDWFDGQDEGVQRQILGPKYQGWANGDFTLADVVGHTHSADWGSSIYEKSLKELVKA